MRRTIIFQLLGLTLVAQAALALEVREVRWGFDGMVVPERFNLLSVLVANNSPEPFDGAVTLQKNQGMGDSVGAAYEQPCYVAPFTERWIQFYPYIGMDNNWRLAWGKHLDEQASVDTPKQGPPGRVFLFDPDDPIAAHSALRLFPDNLFPTSVAAADGLDSVVLDHTPRWEAVKREAFLDWIRRGGTVHLLLGADGKYPNFNDDMSVLNSSLDRVRIGAGWVVRHAVTQREATESMLAASGFPALALNTGQGSVVVYQLTETILRALSGLTRPRHSWGLIYFLTIIYILVVGPGNYLFGKRVQDYRWVMGALLLAVAGFGLLFHYLGRRGQGEASAVHSLSYARAVGDTTYEVTQWINVFVSRGNFYTIRHDAPHNLYATANDYEPVNGVVHSGKDGVFMVDIPLYSQRAFLHQARMTGDDTWVQVMTWPAERDQEFALAVGPHFPSQPLKIWASYHDTIYPMRLADGVLVSEPGKPLSQFLSSAKLVQAGMHNPYGYAGRGPGGEEATGDVEATFSKFAELLIGWSLGGVDGFQYRVTGHPSDNDRIQLFIFARSPSSFSIAAKDFGRETGYVLYHRDCVRPSGEKGTL
jgi:hypothetical protein